LPVQTQLLVYIFSFFNLFVSVCTDDCNTGVCVADGICVCPVGLSGADCTIADPGNHHRLMSSRDRFGTYKNV